MADHLDAGERDVKRVKTDKDEMNKAYMNQILEFMQDEHGISYGYDHDMDSIPELNLVKQELIVGKKEYDSLRENLKGVKDGFSNLAIRLSEQWKDNKYIAGRLCIGSEIWRLGYRVNELENAYTDAFILASNIIKELKNIVNDPDVNKKWEIVDLDQKNELLIFVKEGLTDCVRLIRFCNVQKHALFFHLNEIKNALNHENFNEIIENWKKTTHERATSLSKIGLVIDKLSGKRTFKRVTEDEHVQIRREFNKYLYCWHIYFNDWKMRAYRGIEEFELDQVCIIVKKKTFLFYLL